MMNMKEVKLSLLDIKNLYEYISKKYTEDGISVVWSKFLCTNFNLLHTPYRQIVEGLYDERRDPKFDEFSKKLDSLYRQYVDRDEQGNPIIENNNIPRITEMIVEFQKEKEQLEKEYDDIVVKLTNKNEINSKFLNQIVTVNLSMIDESDIPNQAPPFLVALIINELPSKYIIDNNSEQKQTNKDNET